MPDSTTIGGFTPTMTATPLSSTSGPTKVTPKSTPTTSSVTVLSKVGQRLETLFPGLPALPVSSMSSVALTVALQSAVRRLRGTQMQSNVNAVKSQNQMLETEHKKNIQKFEQMSQKIEKSKSKSKCSRVFGWIAAIFTMIVAVIATVATGGTAAPMLAVAALGVTMMALQQAGKMKDVINGIAKGMTKMLEFFGESKDKAEKIGKYMAMAIIAAVVIVASIIATALSGGAGAGSVAEAVEETVSASADLSEGASDVADTAANVSEEAGNVAESTSQVSEEGLDLSGISEDLENISDEGDTIGDDLDTNLEDVDQTSQTDEASQTDQASNAASKAGGAAKLSRMQRINKALRLAELLMQSGLQAGKGGVDIQAGKAQGEATALQGDMVSIQASMKLLSSKRERLIPDIKKAESYAASLEKAIATIMATQASSEESIISRMRVPS